MVDALLTHVQLSNLLGDGSLKPSKPLARTVGSLANALHCRQQARLCVSVCARVCIYVPSHAAVMLPLSVVRAVWTQPVTGEKACLPVFCACCLTCVQCCPLVYRSRVQSSPSHVAACPLLSPQTFSGVSCIVQSALKLYQAEKGTLEQKHSRRRLVMTATASVVSMHGLEVGNLGCSRTTVVVPMVAKHCLPLARC